MILNKAAISSERVCWWPIKHTVYKQHAFLDMNMVASDFIEGLSFLSTHLEVHMKSFYTTASYDSTNPMSFLKYELWHRSAV